MYMRPCLNVLKPLRVHRDEYEFTRQFIRGKLWKDTEGVVKELEKAIELERTLNERNIAGGAMTKPGDDIDEVARIRSVGRPFHTPSMRAANLTSPMKRHFSGVLIAPMIEVKQHCITSETILSQVDALIIRVHASANSPADVGSAFNELTKLDPNVQGKAMAQLRSIAVSRTTPPGQIIVVDAPSKLGGDKLKWIILAVLSAPERPMDEVKLMHVIPKALEEVNSLGRSLNHGRNPGTLTVAMDMVTVADLEGVPDASSIVYTACKAYRGRIKHIMLSSDVSTVNTSYFHAETLYDVDQEAWRLHFKKAREREKARMREKLQVASSRQQFEETDKVTSAPGRPVRVSIDDAAVEEGADEDGDNFHDTVEREGFNLHQLNKTLQPPRSAQNIGGSLPGTPMPSRRHPRRVTFSGSGSTQSTRPYSVPATLI